MRLHKLKASDTTGTYLVESPVTENDILLMARQLASLRLRKGRALTSPKESPNKPSVMRESPQHLIRAAHEPDELFRL